MHRTPTRGAWKSRTDRVDHGAPLSPGAPSPRQLSNPSPPLAGKGNQGYRLLPVAPVATAARSPALIHSPRVATATHRRSSGSAADGRARHPRPMDSWQLRAGRPVGLVRPVAVDPDGRTGPTKGQARGPRWRRTSTGMYVPSQVERGKVEQRILEESCRLPDAGVVTGWAALRLHGARYFDGLADDGSTLLSVPLVVPPGTPLRRTHGVEVHRERLEADEQTARHGIPCASPVRAAFDAARRAPDVREAVVVLDMSLAARVLHMATFREYLSSKGGWPGIRKVQGAADLADNRSKSPKESALRLIWRLDAGRPAPRCNWPVADAAGMFIGSPDLLCEELAVVGEYDGAEHRERRRHRDDAPCMEGHEPTASITEHPCLPGLLRRDNYVLLASPGIRRISQRRQTWCLARRRREGVLDRCAARRPTP
jgi:hypothetical protein